MPMFGEEVHEAHNFLVFQTTDVRLGHEAGVTVSGMYRFISAATRSGYPKQLLLSPNS